MATMAERVNTVRGNVRFRIGNINLVHGPAVREALQRTRADIVGGLRLGMMGSREINAAIASRSHSSLCFLTSGKEQLSAAENDYFIDDAKQMKKRYSNAACAHWCEESELVSAALSSGITVTSYMDLVNAASNSRNWGYNYHSALLLLESFHSARKAGLTAKQFGEIFKAVDERMYGYHQYSFMSDDGDFILDLVKTAFIGIGHALDRIKDKYEPEVMVNLLSAIAKNSGKCSGEAFEALPKVIESVSWSSRTWSIDSIIEVSTNAGGSTANLFKVLPKLIEHGFSVDDVNSLSATMNEAAYEHLPKALSAVNGKILPHAFINTLNELLKAKFSVDHAVETIAGSKGTIEDITRNAVINAALIHANRYHFYHESNKTGYINFIRSNLDGIPAAIRNGIDISDIIRLCEQCMKVDEHWIRSGDSARFKLVNACLAAGLSKIQVNELLEASCRRITTYSNFTGHYYSEELMDAEDIDQVVRNLRNIRGLLNPYNIMRYYELLIRNSTHKIKSTELHDVRVQFKESYKAVRIMLNLGFSQSQALTLLENTYAIYKDPDCYRTLAELVLHAKGRIKPERLIIILPRMMKLLGKNKHNKEALLALITRYGNKKRS